VHNHRFFDRQLPRVGVLDPARNPSQETLGSQGGHDEARSRTLAILYAAIAVSLFWRSPGGFSTLASAGVLFSNPGLLLAGLPNVSNIYSLQRSCDSSFEPKMDATAGDSFFLREDEVADDPTAVFKEVAC